MILLQLHFFTYEPIIWNKNTLWQILVQDKEIVVFKKKQPMWAKEQIHKVLDSNLKISKVQDWHESGPKLDQPPLPLKSGDLPLTGPFPLPTPQLTPTVLLSSLCGVAKLYD